MDFIKPVNSEERPQVAPATHQPQSIQPSMPKTSQDAELEEMLAQQRAKITQYQKSLELDAQMLDLQKEIVKESESRLENGVITASDYILELNRENLSRNRVDNDKVLLAKAVAAYMTLTGTL